ncbi:ABC transporter permease [Pseudomonas protegens]|uniref:Transport permease protein n=1 Tax=Pseudomonas protegens TaxID=380021 RepID=A0A2T6GCK8_9PSED|nr:MULTISPECIES: ABC transporter permease [Pseudomonas]PUA41887.1 ABC transporter permease [Pseudomonas protegens]ULT71486.1 ABC transporter permease [Pseudomonas sp. BC42]
MINYKFSDLFKWRDLVFNLVAKEIKIRYMGAALGFAWSLGNPLVVTLIYYIVFTYILPSSQDRFALHLVTGVFHWMLFSQIVLQSSDWLIGNSSLIKKLRFPRILLPLSGAITVGSFWLVAMAVYAVLYKFLGGIVSGALFWYPLVLIPYVAMILGLGFAVSVLQITHRDIKHVTEVFVPLLFWLTPIVWVTSTLPQEVVRVVSFNPLAPFFNCFTAILHEGVRPSWADLMLCWGIGLSTIAAGLIVFKRTDKVVELL